jgi:predicted permease
VKLGRPLLDADERSDSRVVVISAEAWSSYFQSSKNVIGQVVMLDGTQHTIIGVLAESFDFPSRQTQFWVPFVEGAPAAGGQRFVNVVARLRDEVSLDEATAEANVIGPSAQDAFHAHQSTPSPVARYRLQRLQSQMTASVAPALRALTIAALFVVLIVSANVATLLVSRSTRHRQERFIQRALGASRGRVIRAVMIEAVMFGAGGAAIGVVLSYASLAALKGMARVNVPELFQLAERQGSGSASVFPRVDQMGLDVSALTFAIAIAFLAAIASGLGPALQVIADDRGPFSANGLAGRLAGNPKSGNRVRNALVVGQVVVATMLLVTAVLLIRSFVQMSHVPMGYDPTNVLSFQLVLPQEYPVSRKETLAHELASRLSALPRVEAAGFASLPPLAGGTFAYGVFQPPGRTLQEMLRDPAAPQARAVSRDYLRAMGVRLLEGRWLDEGDDAGKEPVLLVTRAVARRYFGLRSPIGVQVRLLPVQRPWAIVGVVDDIHNGAPWEEPYSQFFIDSRQALVAMPHLPERMRETAALGFLSYAVRVNGDPAGIVADARTVLHQLDRAAALDGLMPLREIASARVSRPRFYAVWSGVLALIAAVLGIAGVYATVAYATSQRTREIGIRIALGAQRSAVLRLILSHGMGLAAVGVGLGLCGALVLSGYLAGMLFGVTPADPWTYAVVSFLFFGVASAASFLPAHRATGMDPVTAIRHE